MNVFFYLVIGFLCIGAGCVAQTDMEKVWGVKLKPQFFHCHDAPKIGIASPYKAPRDYVPTLYYPFQQKKELAHKMNVSVGFPVTNVKDRISIDSLFEDRIQDTCGLNRFDVIDFENDSAEDLYIETHCNKVPRIYICAKDSHYTPRLFIQGELVHFHSNPERRSHLMLINNLSGSHKYLFKQYWGDSIYNPIMALENNYNDVYVPEEFAYYDAIEMNVDYYANLRSRPSDKSQILTRMYRGSTGFVLQIEGDWWFVMMKKNTKTSVNHLGTDILLDEYQYGWIKSRFVRRYRL